MKRFLKAHWLKLVILAAFFIESVSTPIDLDLGWHLRYGQYFWATGHVLKDNILSYFWPLYHWVEASWGYDVILYPIFKFFGFPGISIAAAIIALATFLVVIRPFSKKSPLTILILAAVFYSQGISIYVAGFRAQTISALMFGVFLVILNDETLHWTLPLIFLLWANLHGGFVIGLAIFAIYLAFNRSRGLVTLFILSILTPLIYPWGIRVYEETLKHSTNTNLAFITEWQPLAQGLVESTVAGLVLAAAAMLLFIRKKYSDIPYILGLALLYFLALNALRFLILFAVLATWCLARTLPEIHFKKVFKGALATLIIAVIIFDLMVSHKYFQMPYLHILRYSWSDFCRLTTDCSEEVTKVMLKDPPKGNGFHPYNYGGYLTWRVPMIKTFLDGRMAAWENGPDRPPIMLLGAVEHQDGVVAYRALDSMYHFRWAIVHADATIVPYLDELVASHLWSLRYSDSQYRYYVMKNE